MHFWLTMNKIGYIVALWNIDQLYYRRYINDIFVLFKSSDHLKRFQSYLNSCHVNMSFSIETQQKNTISFLDVNVVREHGKFVTCV